MDRNIEGRLKKTLEAAAAALLVVGDVAAAARCHRRRVRIKKIERVRIKKTIFLYSVHLRGPFVKI